MRVATYSATGPFAGQMIPLRKIQGNQQWRVVVAVEAIDPEAVTEENPTGRVKDEHVIRSNGACGLIDMQQHVIASINELTKPGLTIKAANMDFYCRSKRK